MKINLKNKIMLAVLAGNMLCMGQALAVDLNVWYGDKNNPNGWKATSEMMERVTDTCTTGANLTLDGTGSYDDANPNADPDAKIAFAEVEQFYAGYSETGNVTNNTITIKDGDFNGCGIYGGHVESNFSNGEASNNTVTISGGTFGDECQIYGGHSFSDVADVSNNIVKIAGGGLWCCTHFCWLWAVYFGGGKKQYCGNHGRDIY